MLIEQFYKATNIAALLIQEGKLPHYPAGDNAYTDIYICMDTPFFLIARIHTSVSGKKVCKRKYCLEFGKIYMEDVMKTLSLVYSKKLIRFSILESVLIKQRRMARYCNQFSIEDLLSAILLTDDQLGIPIKEKLILSAHHQITEILDCGSGIIKDIDNECRNEFIQS